MKWITTQHLKQWADTIGSRSALSQLVSDLIRASVNDISSFRFPTGDASQMRGWDGHLVSLGTPPYVPSGESGWEFGTDRDVRTKANGDYATRTAEPGSINQAATTFVFVSPREWADAETWAAEKQAEGKWKDVKAVDGVALEDWLFLCPAVAARLARDISIMPKVGVRGTDQFWDEYAKQFKPDLTADVLLADRQSQADTILSQMKATGTIHVWQADSTEEVIAFSVAAIRKAEPDVRRFVEDRTLIIDTQEAARQMEHVKNMVLLLRADAIPVVGLLAQRNLVIVPVGRDNPTPGNATLLEQQTLGGLTSGIKTMGLPEEEARKLALSCGRSVTILARQIPSAVAKQPDWAGKIELIPAVLAGSWSTLSEQDQRAIAALASVQGYAEYEQRLLPYLRMQDSPVIKEGDVWQVRAPVDAFAYLGHLVGRRDFDRLQAVVTTVFSETDPSLDLPDDQRLYAEMYGKKLQHSNWLRDGLARTLRLIALRHGPLALTNTGIQPDVFVNMLVSNLPGLATDYHRIASLAGELPILMEAAPRPLLAALGQMLEGDGKALVPIFQDKDPFLSRSPHTGLLWGLEALAWDPEYLGDSTITLAKLARIDPGGKLTNRPLNSLREIFLPWHPGTNASLLQRMAALDRVIAKEPEVGWKLIVELLPGLHDVAFPTAKPRYLEAGASERETLTYSLVAEGRREIVERAFKLAGNNPQRWVELIREMSSFEPPQRARAAELLEGVGTRLDDEKRMVLWSALRSFVARHKAFPTADWAIQDAELAPFLQLVTTIEPIDPIARVVWIFDDWNPAIPEPDKSPSFDLAERTRERTVRDLLSTGNTAILLELARLAKHPELVGAASGRVLGTVEEFAWLVDAAMGKTDNLAIFASVLSAEAERRMGKAWQAQIQSWRGQRPWTDEQFANLVLNWNEERTTWDFVVSLGDEVNRSYWLRKRAWAPRGLSPEDSEIAANSYIAVGRATAAIGAFGLNVSGLSTKTVFKMLDSAIAELNDSRQQLNSEFVFELEQILDALQRRDDAPILEIAKREYAYLPLFGYRDRQLTLHRVMSQDPQFYASLIHDAFNPRHREVPEPTDVQKATAQAAYRLLSEFSVIPGGQGGEINADVLSTWVDAVRLKAKEDDRAEIADEFIGHLLAHAPKDQDGAWPHRAIRDLIERISSAELETGIEVERFNMRGPTSRALYAGGGLERAVAGEIRDWGKRTKAWPRTSAMLERMAQSWDRMAELEDQRSKQDRMRDEQ